jgi:hypothetical protein
VTSLQQLTGKELVPLGLCESDPETAARQLFFSSEVVVSHGTQNESEGPILNYGNIAGLKVWKAEWDELTSMHSIYTADADDRATRAVTMEKVTNNGFVDKYSGTRIALDKSRFRIEDVIIWNVIENGQYFGQAATFPKWTVLSDVNK